MLNVLKFTRYVKTHDEFTVELKMEAEFEGEVLNGFSPVITQSKTMDSLLDKHFRMMVEDVVDQALRLSVEKGLLNVDLYGMSFMDKMSLISIRQTVGFTNDLHKHCCTVSVALLGIG